MSDAEGKPLYIAAERAGSALARVLLKAYRPFEMTLVLPDGAAQSCRGSTLEQRG